MKIEDSIAYATAHFTQPLASTNTTFSSILAGAQQTSVGPQTSTGGADASAAKSAPPSRLENLLEELREYQRKSPMERMREKILESMGLTEEDLAAMPPGQRETLEAAITAEIKARLLAQDKQAPDTTTIEAQLQKLLGAR
jgi:hypothetical protein